MISKNILTFIPLAGLCLYITSCEKSEQTEVLGNGYEEVTFTTSGLGAPDAHQISLQYRGADGKRIMIWPSLGGVKELANNDIIIFSGEAAMSPPDPEEPQATDSRLFTVKAPELPLDITDVVLARDTNQSEGDLEKLIEKARIVYPEGKDNGVVFHFADGPDVYLNWDQILDIMSDVKEKGTVRRDRVWGVDYIKKEFKKGDAIK
jgi:hypothetical protein